MQKKEVEYTRTLNDGTRIRVKTTRWVSEDPDNKVKHMLEYMSHYLGLKESVKKAKDDTELSEMISEINEEKRIMEAFSECMEMLNI